MEADGQELESILHEAVGADEGQEGAQQTQPGEGKPPGYYPVALDGVPEEIKGQLENRFAYFMRQIRDNQRTLGEYRSIAKTQSEKIEELMGGMGMVVDHLHKEKIEGTENQLRQQLKQAHESGDTDAYIAANEKLQELKAKKILLEQQKKTPKQERRETYASAQEIANSAVTDGEITPQEAQHIGIWQQETDEGGEPLRPWAINRDPVSNTDSRYNEALLEAMAVFNSPRFASKTLQEKLDEVDRRMGTKRREASQSVMGRGVLNSMKKTNKIALTPKQKEIALRTRYAGPKATDAEHLEKYRQQIEKIQARGSRK